MCVNFFGEDGMSSVRLPRPAAQEQQVATVGPGHCPLLSHAEPASWIHTILARIVLHACLQHAMVCCMPCYACKSLFSSGNGRIVKNIYQKICRTDRFFWISSFVLRNKGIFAIGLSKPLIKIWRKTRSSTKVIEAAHAARSVVRSFMTFLCDAGWGGTMVQDIMKAFTWRCVWDTLKSCKLSVSKSRM